MMVIGIDADVHRVAYAVVDGDEVRAVETIERVVNRVGHVSERYDARLTALMRRASELGAMVYLEGIWLAENGGRGKAAPRNVQVYQKLAEVQGEIKRAARLCAVPVEIVSPTTWHWAVLGMRAGREALKRAAQKKAFAATSKLLSQFADRELSEHEADAVCITLYAAGRPADAMGELV